MRSARATRARPLRAVDRALRLIDLLANGAPRLGVSDLSRATGWSKAVVFRLLRTLEAHGYAVRDEAGRYRLGTRPLELAGVVLGRLEVHQIARPTMLALAERTGESVVLTAPTARGVLCLDTVDSPQQLRASFRVGRVIPWHAGAAGKLHLTFLPAPRIQEILGRGLPAYTERTMTDPDRLLDDLARIREQGHAFTVGELDPGVAALTMPIWDGHREVVAAVSLGGPAARFGKERLPGLIGELRRAADEISVRLLGGREAASRAAAGSKPTAKAVRKGGTGMKRSTGVLLVLAAVLFLPGRVLSQAPVTFTYIEQQIITASDPAAAVDESSLISAINLYDPLLYPNVEQGSMTPRAHVAESWTLSPDGKVYTFKIRRGMRFHSGRELTAEDVVFSMDRALRLKKGFSWTWAPVLDPGRVRAVDRYTVRFELKDPYAPFLGTLLLFFILDKDLVMSNIRPGPYGEFGDYGTAFLERTDAGSGPYRVERFDRATEMVLVRFDGYWRGWKPNQVSRISYKASSGFEEATVKTLLQTGQADMVNQWLSVQGFRELRQSAGIIVKEDPSVQLFHLELNTKKPPLDNVKVRQAIALAFDYDTAIQAIFEGATKARGPVPVRVPAWNPKLPFITRNPAKARQLLAESGVPAGALSIGYAYVVTIPLERQVGLLLKNNLEAIGFKVEILAEPWARIVEMATKAETTPHITAIYDTLKYPHVDSHTYGMYHPSCWGTFRCMSFYENPKVTQVLEAARRATDPAQQTKLYQEAQAMVVQDYPSIYVANPLHRIAFRNYVQGYRYVGLLGYDVAFYDFTVAR